jgi:hypothetical protein
MAAVTVTVDAVIRRFLALSQLPLHYYVPMLVVAKQGLDEMHFDTLQKVKHVTLTLDATFEAELPADFVEAVAIGINVGDKVRSIGFNDRLNDADDAGAGFEETADQYASTQYNATGTFLENFFNEYGDFKGQQFGRKLTWSDSYTINREEGFIRVDNKSEATEVHLIYLSLPEKISNKSIIHPFAQRALLEFLGWQKAVYFKELREVQYKRNEFYNEYRKLRARLNKLTTVEIKRAIRRNINMAVKS